MKIKLKKSQLMQAVKSVIKPGKLNQTMIDDSDPDVMARRVIQFLKTLIPALQDANMERTIKEAIEIIEGFTMMPPIDRVKQGKLDQVTPTGYQKVVRGLKKNPDVDNPWAVRWSMKNKGIKPKK